MKRVDLSKVSHAALAPVLLLAASCGGGGTLGGPVDGGDGGAREVAAVEVTNDVASSEAEASSDAAGDGDGPHVITEDEFCAMKAEAECQVVPRCATVSMSGCVEGRKALCLSAGALARTGGRTFQPDHVQDCLDKTNATYAKVVLTPADLAALDDVCGYVNQGDVGRLGACTTKYDCAVATLICDKGLCSERVVKAANALCSNPGDTCAAGSVCAKTAGVAFACAPRGALGEACDAGTRCLETLRCAAGKCAARLGAGEGCTSNDDCAASSPFCDPFASNRCDAGLTFAAGGPSCALFGGGDAASGAP
jgi:hypothetical protein